jgi:hypothetical protein
MPARGTVEACKQSEFLGQRMNRETPGVRRKAPGINSAPRVIETLRNAQCADFGEIEITDVVAAIRARPVVATTSCSR